ncbi:protein translocase subunit SecDF [Bacteroidia bacterium]|nr:protein translocase subunit SecDF [Bacteroidia bacterium]
MQNKGALTFLSVALAIACAYQLSFTLLTSHVEKKAEQYAATFAPEVREAKVQYYLDSVGSKPVYDIWLIKPTYRECKQREINLGLDLKGGMNVMLEISIRDVVDALANHSKDPLFVQALDEASQQQKSGSSEDFITLFARNYLRLSANAPLAYVFNTPELKDQITPQSTNDEVIKVLRAQSESAISNSFNVIRSRIDRFGVTQPNIQKLENSGRILVELPGIKEPERVRKLLQGTASLEFWATYDNQEIFPLLSQANQITAVVEQVEAPTVEQSELTTAQGAETDQELQSLLDRGATAGEQSTESAVQTNSLFSKLIPMVDPRTGAALPGPVVGYALAHQMADVNAYLELPQVKALLPRDLKLMWGVKPTKDNESLYELYVIRANTRDGRAPLDGGAVTDAKADYGQSGSAAEVSMSMNSTGAKAWARLTGDNVGQCVAIVLDGYVYSAPRVNQEISGGNSSITGNFTMPEATDLANVLKSGKLPAPAHIIQEAIVGPSLGAESINAGMWSFVLAFILVLCYMFFFYNTAGLVANIALITNLFFLFGVLAAYGAVLTLPGIAGIVLTMGMAVDANVIIYERVKEEIRGGKGIGAALSDGYKHAMSAIVDSNLTTLITGIVLVIFGTGPVQGFAITLVIGILTSFYTSVFISRLVFVSLLAKGRKIKFSTRITRNFLSGTKVNFINIRRYTYYLILALFVVAGVSLATRGLKQGVDFSGGRAFTIRFDNQVNANEVRRAIEDAFPGSSCEVKQYGQDGNQMRIVTQYRIGDTGADVTSEIEELLYKSMLPFYDNQNLSLEDFATNKDPNGIISADNVGPSVASDIKRDAVIAVLFSILAISLYIAMRFRKWEWAMGATSAIVHDVIITVGIVSLLYSVLPFTLELDQAFIAAILTIIGYSVNDTVIIFDRIREYSRIYPKRTMKDNINQAINSTLARTVNTAGTTLVVLLAIFIFGGEVIRGFVFTLLLGVAAGTLSSIFVATPVAYDMIRMADKKKKTLEGKDA